MSVVGFWGLRLRELKVCSLVFWASALGLGSRMQVLGPVPVLILVLVVVAIPMV